jgi:hypothetical protein
MHTPKSSTVTPERVGRALVRGIEKAQHDYEDWSTDWLWDAPEYLLTVYAARELAKIADSSFITLEHSAREAIHDAGARGRGKLKAAIRERGRFDILLWRPDGTPRAPVELKCQVTRYRQIEKDVSRVLAAIGRSRATSSIAFGAIAFSTAEVDGKDFTAAERVSRYVENIAQSVEESVAKVARVLRVSSRPVTEDDQAWCATAIVIKPK